MSVDHCSVIVLCINLIIIIHILQIVPLVLAMFLMCAVNKEYRTV